MKDKNNLASGQRKKSIATAALYSPSKTEPPPKQTSAELLFMLMAFWINGYSKKKSINMGACA